MISKRTTIIILSGLICVALALRLPIIFYGMPYALGNPDESLFVGQALYYGATGSIKPIVTYFPVFYSYILALSFGVSYFFQILIGATSGSTEFAANYLLYPGDIHFAGRLLSLMLAMLSIWMLYLCGLQLKDRLTGLIAAALFVLSYTILQRTVWLLPASLFILTGTASLFFILRYIESKQPRDLIWSGLLCGLGIAAKINTGSLAILGCTAVYMAHRSTDRFFSMQTIKAVLRTPALYVYIGCVCLGFLGGSPYWILDIRNNIEGILWELGRLETEQGGSGASVLSRIPFLWVFAEMIITESASGVVMAASLGYVAYRSFKKDDLSLLVAPYLLITLLLIGRQYKHSIHYFLPVFPVMFVMGAVMLRSLRESIKIKPAFLAMALAIGILLSLWNTAAYTYSYTGSDTRLQATEWIRTHVPPGSAIVIGKTFNAPPLPDLNRFNKPHYTSISEQLLAQRLPDGIRNAYMDSVRANGYRVIHYLEKRSEGRGTSYADMMSGFSVLDYDMLTLTGPSYLVFSSDDLVYLRPQGYGHIRDVPGYAGRLEQMAQFSPGPDNLYCPDLTIYKLAGSTDH